MNIGKRLLSRIIIIPILMLALLPVHSFCAADEAEQASPREMAKKVDALGKQVSRLQGTRDELTAELKECEVRLEDNRETNKALEKQNKDLSKRGAALEGVDAKYEKLKKDFEEQKQSAQDLEKQRDKLQVQLQVLEERFAELKQRRGPAPENNAAARELVEVQQENVALKGQLKLLEEQVQELQDLASRRERPISDEEEQMTGTEAQISRATKLYEQGMVSEASDMFRKVLAEDADNLPANLGLAYCKYSKNLYREALDLARKMEEKYPGNPQVFRLKGLAAWRCGELGQASGAFRQALEIVPDSSLIHNYLGVVCYAQGDYETARREFTQAVELDDSLVEAHYNLAVLLSSPEKNDYVGARKHYEKAIELGRKRDEELENKLYR